MKFTSTIGEDGDGGWEIWPKIKTLSVHHTGKFERLFF